MDTDMPMPDRDRRTSPHASLAGLRLMFLASPTLPIGAYAYSQGLEACVHQGYVTDCTSALRWIRGLMREVIAEVDLPILARIHRAWAEDDRAALRAWSSELIARRETRELQDEEWALGRALARLLRDLEVPRANWLLDADPKGPEPTLAGGFALATHHFSIPITDAAIGYLYTWAENQLAAATRLIPLGQTEARRALLELLEDIPQVADYGLQLSDDEIGASAPGLALLSSAHETQYTRLFRS